MDLENIKQHIDKLKHADWQRLFDLIPRIEKNRKFGENLLPIEDKEGNIQISPMMPEKIVHDFTDIMYELDLVIGFNWSAWDEGRKIASENKYENLDTITLLKLLTALIRNDRFCDGVLVARFEDGSILKILKELKGNINKLKNTNSYE